jgi:hypothetical protein
LEHDEHGLLNAAANTRATLLLHSGTLIYAECHYGFPKDEKMARRYYSMVVRATIDECAAINKEAAATWLREHPAA